MNEIESLQLVVAKGHLDVDIDATCERLALEFGVEVAARYPSKDEFELENVRFTGAPGRLANLNARMNS